MDTMTTGLRRVAVLTVALVMALGVADASAAPFTPQLNLAYDVALHYWGEEPTRCSSIDRQIVPPGGLVALWGPTYAGVMGAATQPPPGSLVPCQLYVDRSLAEPHNAATACETMLHEFGHLLGYPHSSDPASPMSPGAPQRFAPCRWMDTVHAGQFNWNDGKRFCDIGDRWFCSEARAGRRAARQAMAKLRRFVSTLAP